MMKKIFKSRITMVILSCLLLVGVFAGVTAIAEDEKSVNIAGVNIAHDGTVKIHYDVEVKGYDLTTHDVRVYFWGTNTVKDENGDYTTPDLKSDINENEIVDVDGVQYERVFSRGFAPAEMTQVVYAVAVIEDAEGTPVAYSDKVVRYSIFEHICYLNYNGGEAGDVEIFNAMKDYITYAQEYLNWDYSITNAPDQLVYLQVNNGYIEPMDGTDNKYTSGVYLAGTDITVVSTYADDTFGNWRNDLTDKPTYIADAGKSYGLKLEDDVVLTAVPKVTVSVTDGEIIPLNWNVTAQNGRVDYGYVRQSTTAYEGDLVTSAWCAVSADFTRVNGETTEYFSHWVDAEGNYVSTAATYVLDATAGSSDFANIALTPVYVATAPTTASVAYTAVTQQAVDVYSGDDTTGIYNLDSTSRTANASGGSGIKLRGNAASASAVAQRTVYSFTMNIKPHSEATGTALTDFFTSSGNLNQYQCYFGSAAATYSLIEFHAIDLDGDKNYDGYYVVTPNCTSTPNDKSYYRYDTALRNGEIGVAAYGTDCKIDLEFITDTEGGTNSFVCVNLYMNGEYVGTSSVRHKDYATYKANTYLNMDFNTLMRTRSILTVSGASVDEYTYTPVTAE